MPNRLLRPLLIVEFLVALQVIFTVWSEVGGQYHLDLMFWAWKMGLATAGAALITGITATIIQHDGEITRKALLFGSLLLVTAGAAGLVTYYYHLNEPTEQQDDEDEAPTRISRVTSMVALPAQVVLSPGAARFPASDHR